MIPELVDAWNINKHHLEKYFQGIVTNVDEYSSIDINYSDIVKKLFELVINPHLLGNSQINYLLSSGFNVKNLTIIDHGHYQGTELFLIPIDTYQPDATNYIWASNYYGSCSGCDALESIKSNGHIFGEDKENEELVTSKRKQQVNDLMALALHLIQRFKYLQKD